MQRTLCDGFEVEGIGLHSGQRVVCEVLPAPEDSGFSFERIDCPRSPRIPARWEWVKSGRMATTLCKDGVEVSTVEHLLAALYGMGVDNAHVRLTSREVPVCDGSALIWVEAIEQVGIVEQDQARRVHSIVSEVVLSSGDRRITASAADGLMMQVTVDFEHPMVGREDLALELSPSVFKQEIAWARTFGFEKDLVALRSMGLGLGGSLENALVFGDDGVINPEGLRGAKEVVRHKVLDLVGDLALAGCRISGQLVVERPGHEFTHQFLKTIQP